MLGESQNVPFIVSLEIVVWSLAHREKISFDFLLLRENHIQESQISRHRVEKRSSYQNPRSPTLRGLFYVEHIKRLFLGQGFIHIHAVSKAPYNYAYVHFE